MSRRFTFAGALTLAALILACSGAPATTQPLLDDSATPTEPSAVPTESPTETVTETPPVLAGSTLATVVSVIDGDTVQVVIGSNDDVVRLIGVNAPEYGECFATESTEFLAALVEGRDVFLTGDVSERDQFDRRLAYLWLGELLVNESLVEKGYALAVAFQPDTARQSQLAEAQQRAEASDAGLWAEHACGAASPANLIVAEINYNPPGDESNETIKNAEWVRIENAGGSEADLTGWVLKDESASHRYRFPDGFRLAPQSSVRVRSGCGSDSATDLHWCNRNSAVWNNDGDTAFLLDPNGNVAHSRTY